MVAVGVSSRTPESLCWNAARNRSRLRKVFPDPAAPVNNNFKPLCYRGVSYYKKSLQILVRNQTRNTVLADSADVADSSAKRRTGLLKHDRLAPGQGLWIVPCESVHSFFMKFPIDLVYLDRKHKVRKIRHNMAPWRMSICLSAHSILELPAGVLAATGTQAGDQLAIEEQ